MQTGTKWAGVILVVGGLMMFMRMGPIFAVLPEDMAFPPESTEEMVRLAAIAGPRWQLSHVMGLVAVALFVIAYGWHVRLLIRLGWKRVGPGLAVIATAAFGLVGIALCIDGFVVPETIQRYLSTTAGDPVTLRQVADAHGLALSFFTPGFFLLFVAIGLLSVAMLQRSIHSRWLGVAGQIIAILAVIAYVTGAAGPNWDNLQIAGTLMMAAFAWHILVGARALLGKPMEY